MKIKEYRDSSAKISEKTVFAYICSKTRDDSMHNNMLNPSLQHYVVFVLCHTLLKHVIVFKEFKMGSTFYLGFLIISFLKSCHVRFGQLFH